MEPRVANPGASGIALIPHGISPLQGEISLEPTSARADINLPAFRHFRIATLCTQLDRFVRKPSNFVS
jgi:hypothetical protein